MPGQIITPRWASRPQAGYPGLSATHGEVRPVGPRPLTAEPPTTRPLTASVNARASNIHPTQIMHPQVLSQVSTINLISYFIF